MPKCEVRHNVTLVGVWKMKGPCNPFSNNFPRHWDSEKAAPWCELLTGNTCQVQHPCMSRGARTKGMPLSVSAWPCKTLLSPHGRDWARGSAETAPWEAGSSFGNTDEFLPWLQAVCVGMLGWQSAGHPSNAPDSFCSQAARALKPLSFIWYLFYLHPHQWGSTVLSYRPPRPPPHKATAQGTLRPVKVSFHWVSAAPGYI